MLKRALLWIERCLAYVPELTLKGTPEHVGLEYEDLWLKTEDGHRINSWWMPGPRAHNGAPRPTWVYFHGSGGNISARLDGYRSIHQRLGANVLAVDYRGFGLSEGTPTEQGTYADAHAAAMEALRRNESQPDGPGPVVFFGVSMGAAIATRIAAEQSPHAMLLESAPPSFPDMAPVLYPWTRFLPVKMIMQLRYETRRHVARIRVPSLFVHGDQDGIVPLKYGNMAYSAANDPKRMLIVPGGTHDRPDLVDPEAYYGAVTQFMAEHIRWRMPLQQPQVLAAD
jgi:fermentation-respiration switch protein FrsA (DUF1100 family)